MKKGIVFKIKDKNTIVVMTPDFNFEEVKTRRKYEIGDQIEIKTVIRWDRIAKYASAAVAIMILFSTSANANLDNDKPGPVVTAKELKKPNPVTSQCPLPSPTPEPDIEQTKQEEQQVEEPSKEKKSVRYNKNNSQVAETNQRKAKQHDIEEISIKVPPQHEQPPQPKQTPKPKQTPQPDTPQPEQPPQPAPQPEQPPQPGQPPETLPTHDLPKTVGSIIGIKVPAININVASFGVQVSPQKSYIKPNFKRWIRYNERMNRRGKWEHYNKVREGKMHSAVLALMEKASNKFGVEQTDDLKVLLDLLAEKGVIDQKTKAYYRDYIFENSVASNVQ